ncbi:MAG: metallophosphoesterase family protein [bacterium]|nr:metallophosphoesterase family protein [bacterium]
MPKLYAIGDIHGQRRLLRLLIERVPFEKEDEIVFIGDYIDRGPDSRGVVEDVLEFRLKYPRSVFLRGNHEDMFLDYVYEEGRYQSGIFLMNGGYETLQSYGIDPREGPPQLPALHAHFFQNLQYVHQSDGFIFVHAGFRPGVRLSEQKPEDLMWIRKDFFESDADFGRPVVFGHTPMPEVLNELPRFLGIDTGAAYGRKLTCVQLAGGKLIKTYQADISELNEDEA